MQSRSSRTQRGDETGLVRPVLLKRLGNELTMLNARFGLDLPALPDDVVFPVILELTIAKVPALAAPENAATVHRIRLAISDEYPYERPRAVWLTPIFHPNIMDPADGGFVCVKMLSSWSFGSTLVSFVEGLEQLLRVPNPDSPLGTSSCLAAAAWYREHAPKVNATVVYDAGNGS